MPSDRELEASIKTKLAQLLQDVVNDKKDEIELVMRELEARISRDHPNDPEEQVKNHIEMERKLAELKIEQAVRSYIQRNPDEFLSAIQDDDT